MNTDIPTDPRFAAFILLVGILYIHKKIIILLLIVFKSLFHFHVSVRIIYIVHLIESVLLSSSSVHVYSMKIYEIHFHVHTSCPCHQ